MVLGPGTQSWVSLSRPALPPNGLGAAKTLAGSLVLKTPILQITQGLNFTASERPTKIGLAPGSGKAKHVHPCLQDGTTRVAQYK